MTVKPPRTWRSAGFFPFRLEVLTPVHIGSGDVLSPLDYVIRQKNGTARLYRIDLQSWLMRHGAEPEVQQCIATGDLLRIRRMLDERVDETVFAVSSSPITDLSLARELKSALAGAQPRDAAHKGKTGDVAAALRNPLDNCLYIPGSSLKGAISTPLINWLDRSAQSSLREAAKARQERRWLEDRFGPIREHAMQALKVSDISAPFAAGAVVRARERSRNPDKKGTPKPPCEVIMPGGGNMWGRFLLDSSGTPPAITLPTGKTISLPALARCCTEFYLARFKAELQKFYQLPQFRDTAAALREVEAKIIGLAGDDATVMLVRVGHYSHVESVTVDNNQPHTRKGRDGRPMPSGTTRTLADNLLPFGWVLLHFCSAEAYTTGMAEAEAERRAAVAAQTEQLRRLQQQAEAQAAQASLVRRQQEERRRAEAEKAAEEQKQREALERRMAELSLEEARLLQLETVPSEALSMEIFREMRGWSPELQRTAAEALRACWMQLGKWEGALSKKQKEKVKEIKALLE